MENKQKVTKSWLLGFVKATIANFVLMILNRRYGITITPSDNLEADACQAIQIATMRERVQAEDMMERTADKYTSGAMEKLKEAICEGMSIECGEGVTMADIFALIDTSINYRISQALHLRNVASEHPLGSNGRDWKADCEELEYVVYNSEGWCNNPALDNDAVLDLILASFDNYKKARKEA